jgi:hypothetical protein
VGTPRLPTIGIPIARAARACFFDEAEMARLPVKCHGRVLLHPGEPRGLVVERKRLVELFMQMKIIALVFIWPDESIR